MAARRIPFTGWLVMALTGAATIFLATSPPFSFYPDEASALIVSFKRTTARVHPCDKEETKAYREYAETRRPHMRKTIAACGNREKKPVTLTMALDGEPLLERTYEPSGFRKDGSIYVHERVTIQPGTRYISLSLIEGSGDEAKKWRWDEVIEVETRKIVLIDFNDRFERRL